MNNISKTDIKIFGKVLKAIGERFSTNPELLISILNKEETKPKQKTAKNKKSILPSSIDNTDLFSYSKSHSKDEIVKLLNDLNIDELKQRISHYNLGYTKLRSKEKIIEYIADQFKKRTTDVFLKHEK
jgi:hypothetical protein